MADFLNFAIDSPIPNILVVAGIVFLGIAAVGRLSGKVELDKWGRLISGIGGAALLAFGLFLNISGDAPSGPETRVQKHVRDRTMSVRSVQAQSGENDARCSQYMGALADVCNRRTYV